jgi:hypothetical protein
MEKHGCMYAGFCRFYRKDSHECVDEAEAEAFCGTFKLFENFETDERGIAKKIFVP